MLSTVPSSGFICKLYFLRSEKRCVHVQNRTWRERYISFTHSPVLLRSHRYRAFSSFLNLSIHISHSSDLFSGIGLTNGCETGLIVKELRGSLGAEISAERFSGCSSASGDFYQKTHKHLTGSTFTTQSTSSLLAEDEATQLVRFIARSGFRMSFKSSVP